MIIVVFFPSHVLFSLGIVRVILSLSIHEKKTCLLSDTFRIVKWFKNVPKNPMFSSGIFARVMDVVYRHTYRKNTHTQKIVK